MEKLKEKMDDDGEVEASDHGLLPNPYSAGNNIQTSASIDLFLDEFLKNTKTCTHTHTCNSPGPDAAHTHTCYHTHTQVFPSGEDAARIDQDQLVAKPRRPSGNREAVRKYREKKKAHTAFLEEEVKKLRLLNQQLIRKLQGQAILEAEIFRLRGLLLDFRGKIDNELGVNFPLQKQCNATNSFKEGNCGVQYSNGSGSLPQCENDLPCFHPHLMSTTLLQGTSSSSSLFDGNGKMVVVSWEENCQAAVIDCRRANTSDAVTAEGCSLNAVETLVSSASQAD